MNKEFEGLERLLVRVDERTGQTQKTLEKIEVHLGELNGRVSRNEKDILTAKVESRATKWWLRAIVGTGTLGFAIKWFLFPSANP